MKKMRFGLMAVAMLFGTGSLFAQDQKPESTGEITTLKSGTQLRVLDVTIVDKKGNPVTSGLTRDDFTVLDNKKKKDILALDGPTGTPSSVSLPTSTIFVIDHVNTPFEDEYWQLHEMEAYLKDQGDVLNQPTELLVLNDTGVQVVEGFTTDRGDLLEGLKSIRSVNPYRLTANWNVENLSLAMGALEEISLQTKNTPGRKNVIWIGSGGAGLNTDGLYHREFIERFVRRTSNLMVESRVTLFLIMPALKVSSVVQPRGISTPLATAIDPINGSINALVAVPLASDPFTGSYNMRTFARITGGDVFLNSNNLVTEIHDSMALGTKYYTLSYKPDPDTVDGKFRRIEVKLKNPDYRILTKDGYYGLAKDDVANQGENQARFEVRKAATSSVAFSQVNLQVKGVTHYAQEQTSVFDIYLKPSDLKLEQAPDGSWKGEIVIAAISTNANHDILASASKQLAIAASTTSMAHATTPVLKVSVNLRVPRRASTLRFVVRDMGSGKMGAMDMSRKVADATPIANGPMPGPPQAAAPPANKPGF